MSVDALYTGYAPMEIKRISVSKKRQITIPQKFFEKLNIREEVECIMTNSAIIIRPVRRETEFAEEILEELINKGYEGPQLLEQFKIIRTQVRPAIEKMIEEAQSAANNLKGSGDVKMKEIFADLED
ncbi:AbrB/MazE/SpoVT family DNA-binding domain-containing protein [Pelotomaculum isophthalicicum JI]|uniref:AbrB/MazE/SpoVT family DNA-binding domain-containing protein n=1 Tax=Pelotomaculum isophthalicicum JI TaxID=947010 RepID=A0A9X4JV36_9FIRM|nr:AbrB/MazE/SpoVT family DNA-binding domain-containing protein [Pelotomaculum isophthalicicum]MDF9406808.1 AbrB/MazE/SpoVT family DNA-binding domain-containing protein [Pelotomaculum isophthalicicum JI]